MVTRRLCNCALHPACSSHAETELLPLQAANCEHAFAGVLRSIAQAGGAALWANSAKGYEDALQLCLAHLEDASRATGDAFAGALGDLVAASKSPSSSPGGAPHKTVHLCAALLHPVEVRFVFDARSWRGCKTSPTIHGVHQG